MSSPCQFCNGPIVKCVSKAAVVIGIIYILYWTFVALNGVYARLFRPGKNLKKVYGQWGKLEIYLL